MKLKHIGAFFLLSFAIFSLPHSSYAQSATGTPEMLTGWAWSSNIGWVSFNCDNFGTCLNDEAYNVTIDPSTGALSGYAWSSNIGWIQFGGLSGFPSGNGTTAQNAALKGSTLTGWARALSAGSDGGWDGWISLSGSTVSTPVNYHNSQIPVGGAAAPTAGTQGSYGVTVAGNNLNSFAWGSDVVGWLSFSGPGYGVGIEPGGGTGVTTGTTTTDTGSEDCTGPDGTVIPNGSSKVYYQDPTDATTGACVPEERICTEGVLSGTYVNPECAVTAPVTSFTSGVAPKVTLSIAPQGGVFSHGPLVTNAGTQVELQWSFASTGGAPDSCTGSASLAPFNPLTLTLPATLLQNLPVVNSSTYTISCSNAFGTSSDSVRTIVFAVTEF